MGILARLPLASGLLAGKFLSFELGVELADDLRWIADGRHSMAVAAMRWILAFDAVTCVIPGFKNADQVDENLRTLNAPPFNEDEMARLAQFYRERVHADIRGSY